MCVYACVCLGAECAPPGRCPIAHRHQFGVRAHAELLFASGGEFLARGECMAADRTISQALALCEKSEADAKAADPEHVVDPLTQSKLAQCYLERCMARTKLERYSDAMEDVAQAVVLSPRSAGAYHARGKVCATAPALRTAMARLSGGVMVCLVVAPAIFGAQPPGRSAAGF